MRKTGKYIILLFLAMLLVGCTAPAQLQADQIEPPVAVGQDSPAVENELPEGYNDAVMVGEALKNCFFSFVTQNGDEYITASGNRIKNLDVYGLDASEELTPADLENGIVWKGFVKLTFIINEGKGWEDEDALGKTYLLKNDGSIETWGVGKYECGQHPLFR